MSSLFPSFKNLFVKRIMRNQRIAMIACRILIMPRFQRDATVGNRPYVHRPSVVFLDADESASHAFPQKRQGFCPLENLSAVAKCLAWFRRTGRRQVEISWIDLMFCIAPIGYLCCEC